MRSSYDVLFSENYINLCLYILTLSRTVNVSTSTSSGRTAWAMQFTATVPRMAALSIAAAASGAAVTGATLRVSPTGSTSHTQGKIDINSPAEKLAIPSHSIAGENAAQFIIADGYEEYALSALPQRPRHFLKSEDNSERLGFRYFRRKTDGAVSFVASFGSHVEGPPGYVHGGCSAAILDSAMGMVAYSGGHRSVTANLTCNYRAPIPVSTVQRVDAKIDKIDGRKVYLSSKIQSPDGTMVYVESTALFIKPDPAKVVVKSLGQFIKNATSQWNPGADARADR